MSTIFEKIIAGEIPATFVWQDEICVAFMDVNPMAEGHCLVVPRDAVDHFFDVPFEQSAHLMMVAQKISKTADRVFDCTRVGLVIAGYGVPHTHLHLIPINSEKELDPTHKIPTNPEQILHAGEKLRHALLEDGYQEARL
ncbi:HIT family protein [Boudabousia marimammalium]|uniref:HIT domain-containing protein n=1 Tax=Boudabousia marimammalium TaxID=156892 RepID=A0A1Q5PRS7_9ACTO|nr:HIT family protein [Boudabousia marimammalium]OKL50142.1 hypothetical protein BM477_01715 [Boudabousia marimammalium]